MTAHLWEAVSAESAREKQELRKPTAVSRIAAAQTAERTTRKPYAAGAVTCRSCPGNRLEYLQQQRRSFLKVSISGILGLKPSQLNLLKLQ